MKTNTTNVTIKTTICKVAILYNDNTSEVKDILLVGKYTIKSAKTYFKNENEIANKKNIEVLSVETTNTTYTVDTIKLNNFCDENKIVETE